MLSSLLNLKAERAVVVPRKARPLVSPWRWLYRSDVRQIALILLGIAAFLAVYLSPLRADAVDPWGKHFVLSRAGQASLALFLLTGLWWIFEVAPIGVTGVVVGVVQVLFAIRTPQTALGDFFHPAIWFIFASLIIGKSFIKSGLTQRLAYTMLALIGERTRMIYLGCGTLIALLTLIMAHTAAAATMYPLLMAIHSLYQENGQPTRFGKGLFIGMAFTAAAGSVATMLGAARGIAAAGFYQEIIGTEINFTRYSFYLLPLAWVMVFLAWLVIAFLFPPEKKTIPGLKSRALDLVGRLGPLSRAEGFTLAITATAVLLICLRSFLPALQSLDSTGILLATIPLFFLLKILTLQDLEEIPWNMILFFGGALSLGFCLWQTGASQWLAINCLPIFQHVPPFVFILCLAVVMLIMTNFIMNLVVIALVLPVALVMAPYLGVAPMVIFFTCLAAAGMPFMFLIGAAPNAIAYESRQFTQWEFLKAGLIVSALLLVMLGLFVQYLWPLMGLSVLPAGR